jgi:hypothetical protein
MLPCLYGVRLILTPASLPSSNPFSWSRSAILTPGIRATVPGSAHSRFIRLQFGFRTIQRARFVVAELDLKFPPDSAVIQSNHP